MSVTTTPQGTELLTGDQLLALGDIGPCELVDGRIVPMTPTGGEHGVVELVFSSELYGFVRQRGLGWVMVGEVGIYTRRNPDRVRGADVVFISRERLAESPRGYLEVAPELVVEIISPGDRWQDIRQKLEEYFAIGVRWVWIVEPENRAVLAYRSSTDVQKFAENDTLTGEGILQGFTLSVATLFGE
jgi:Uma2 family endonuclease